MKEMLNDSHCRGFDQDDSSGVDENEENANADADAPESPKVNVRAADTPSVRLSASDNAKYPQSPLDVLICVLQVGYMRLARQKTALWIRIWIRYPTFDIGGSATAPRPPPAEVGPCESQ